MINCQMYGKNFRKLVLNGWLAQELICSEHLKRYKKLKNIV